MTAQRDATQAGPGFSCALVGADSLLVECGEILLAQGHRISVVAASSPKVATWAAGHDLPVVDATGPAAGWSEELRRHDFEWLFTITHLALLPDDVVGAASAGAINFHDGPLPRYAGLNTPAWALLRGEATYGITWHLITSGIDEGDVVARRDFEIAAGETSLSLNTRNFENAIESFEELVGRIAADQLRPEAQPTDAERHLFSRHDRPEALALLDWRQPAVDVDRVVRALTFGPYPNPLATPKVLLPSGKVATIGRAEVVDGTGAPGQVLELDDDGFVVACADGAVALAELRTPTGGEVSPADLGIAEGSTLPVLDDDARARLSEIGATAARHEARVLAALGDLEPVEVPWARTPAADHRPEPATHPLQVPAGADDGQVVAAAALLLGRLARKDRFHLGLVTPAPEGVATDLLGPAVPLEVVVDGATLADVVDTTADRLRTAVDRGPALGDLVGRHPDLAADPRLGTGQLLPVAIGLTDRGETLLPGVALELRRTAAGWALVTDRSLLDAADVGRFAASLEAILGVVVDAPSTPAAAVELVDAATRTRLLETWNDTALDVAPACIHDLFEAQADATPDAVALVFEETSLTYRELDERADRLAAHLREHGVGRGDLVGVHVPRSTGLVESVLAVHKAGAAYVPLDPTYPRDRVAHMVRDSGCRVIVSDGPDAPPADGDVTVIDLTRDAAAIAARPAERVASVATPDDVAYCIYTSGSTGLPKGVLVEHRNAVNFFAAMDSVVAPEPPGTWLAVTSLSFDISVLELLYTLTRGFEVVVFLDRVRTGTEEVVGAHSSRPMDFSLFYFSGDASEGGGREQYRLLLDGARFADEHGFVAVWTPERHFHDFGGLYPNPAVTGAAVAAITEHVAIRAGSVVVPLQHPIRIAEAWSIVDNISDGRVGISVASGWQPDDFVLRPETWATAKQTMFDEAEEIKRLWRGEAVEYPRPDGTPLAVRTLPRPVQPELPIWVTSAGNVETYVEAGRRGANVLTHLLGQSVDQLAPKIEAYRRARADAGHDPDAGIVSLMLHTFVGSDDDAVRDAARQPLKDYLGTSFSLLKEYAWAFPAFNRPEGATDDGLHDDDFKNLDDEDLDAVLEFAFQRYYETSGLFGTPERCLAMVDRLKAIGVDEVACLVDFGIDTDTVLESLPILDDIRRAANEHVATEGEAAETPAAEVDHSFAAQVARHGVTHLQCTPSMARMLSQHDESRAALATIAHLFIGGEAFPVALADDLRALAPDATITNMYGPTETTIWSTTHDLEGPVDDIPIGTPIANTNVYVLDDAHRLLPPGVAGDLWIGGDGVVRGYHDRPELNAERFVPDPFLGDDHRMYTTGDLARWRELPDGRGILEYLGRADHQVKIRGYRIELGEIEAQMGSHPDVLECVAVVREDTPGDQQLVGYVSPRPGRTVDAQSVKDHLRRTLPDVMIPGHVAVLPTLPHTPNGKINRNALPSLAEVLGARAGGREAAPADNDTEREVLAIWAETLGNDDIGVDDNFFDIGGHSLLVVRLHRRLRDALDVTCPLTDLYRYPTVRSFAASLEAGPSTEVVQRGRDRAAKRRNRRRGR